MKSNSVKGKPFYVRKCEEALKKEGSVIKDHDDAFRFVDSAVKTNLEIDLFSSLSTTKGCEVFEEVLNRLDYTNPSEVDHFFQFIELLSKDSLVIGLRKPGVVKILATLCDIYGVIPALENAVENLPLSSKTYIILAWMISFTAINCNEKKEALIPLYQAVSPKVTGNTAALGFLKNAFGVAETTNPAQKSSSKQPTAEDLKAFEPIHDNDFPKDFRKIQILPTVNEINTNYPLTRLQYTWLNQNEVTDLDIINRQFRLLREDMLRPLKDELEKILNPKYKNEFLKQKLFNPIAYSICVERNNPCCVNIAFQPNDNLLKRLSKLKSKEVLKFFDEDANKLLSRDSLILFVDNSNQVIHIGLIVNRDAKEMARIWNAYQRISVGIMFQQTSLKTIIMNLCPLDNIPPSLVPLSSFVIQSKVSYFSYEPVLQCLKKMEKLQLREEIVQLPPTPRILYPTVIPETIVEQLSSDRSQLSAVQNALCQRVSIIQGPPGTGKTFVGVKIVKTLLREQSNRILCICYTNHALDSFLESLLDDGVDLMDIVRFGTISKISERIKDCCFQYLEGSDFSRGQSKRYFSLKESTKAVEDRIKSQIDSFTRTTAFGSNSFQELKEFLKDTGRSSLLKQFEVARDEVGGFSTAGKDGKSMKEDQYFKSWCAGSNRPKHATFNFSPTDINLWDLERTERVEHLQKWWREYSEEFVDEAVRLMENLDALRMEMKSLRDENKVDELDEKRIVACTTTFAAKNRDLIDSCGPNVVIVEEAAEIHESHVLTNLTAKVERLIMIGDHKQLRPKLEHYPLRVDSGSHIDFDVSLFERLVKAGYEPAQLRVQHRMRPHISHLIKDTYPHLEDHPSVNNRDNILGMSRNVVWIDHRNPENTEHDAFLTDLNSKSNAFEAKMSMRIVKYFLQQGYRANDIVILTPYLGQLMKLRSLMRQSKELSALLDERDQDDLNDGGDADSAEEHRTRNNIRVATIDNFQGEESKIIIASLVRSNADGDIGFVSGAERVNVLCSRARDGFILIGNSDTFRNARSKPGKEVWEKVYDKLNEDGSVLPGFPALCPIHNKPQIVRTPEEFDVLCPEGGCNELCKETIPSCTSEPKHTCPKRCHVFMIGGKNLHNSFRCEVKVNGMCSRDIHPLSKYCFSEVVPICSEKMSTTCPNLHKVPHRCNENPPPCLKCEKLMKEKQKQKQILQADQMKAQEEYDALQEKLQNLSFDLNRAKEMEELLAKNALLELEEEIKEIERKQRLLNESKAEMKREKPVQRPAEKKKDVTPPKEDKEVKPEKDNKVKFIPPKDEKEVKLMDPLPLEEEKKKTVKVTPRTQSVSDTTNDVKPPSNSAPPALNNPKSTNPPEKTDSQEGTEDTKPDESSGKEPPKVISKSPKPKKQSNNSSTSNPFVPTSMPSPKIQISLEPPLSPLKSGRSSQTQKELLTTLALVKEERWIETLHKIKASHPEFQINDRFTSDTTDLCDWMLLFILANLYLSEDIGLLIQRIKEVESLLPSVVDNISPLSLQELNLLSCYVKMMVYFTVKTAPNVTKSVAEKCLKDFDEFEKSNASSHIPSSWKSKITEIIQLINDEIAKSNNISSEPPMKQKWNNLRSSCPNNPPSPSIDSLLDMIGLTSIKEEFLNLYLKITVAKNEQKMSLDGFNFNALFIGNPGTGKTTVAKLFASFLTEVGMFDFDCQVVMKTGSELRNDGVDGLEEILNQLKSEGGGVIFIDEAYQLNDAQGRPVIDYILANSEKMKDKFGKLIWILAGYKKQMEDFLKVNPGLPSRFPNTFKFEDYTDSELEGILKGFFDRGGQDVIAKKGPPKKPPQPKVTAPLGVPRNTPYNPFDPYNAYNPPDEVDQWGNIWKWDPQRSTFCDAYGNVSGYGNKNGSSLGSRENPIVSKTAEMWVYDSLRDHFYNMSKPSQVTKTYPGKPEEPVDQKIVPFQVSNLKWIRVSARRIGRGRGVEGFGNARTVRTFFQKAHDRQVKRIDELRQCRFRPNVRMFERNDLLGPKASRENLEASLAWKELQEMEGLKEVKESMDLLLQTVITNGEREEEEKELMELVLNRVFLGNPGTGKTTVAQLYGRILADLGMLTKGDMVLKTASDFVGSVLGKSEEITRGILEQSKGCVLVIDEAYGLYSSVGSDKKNEPYREAVVNTLVEQIQGRPGEDRAVLMLGYRKEMEDMFANTNPGLSRRFQLENSFVFKDYDNEALLRIMKKAIKKQDMKIDQDTALFAIEQLEKARARPHFGNAGAVNNLLSDAKIRMQKRLREARKNVDPLNPIDKDLLMKDDFKDKNYRDKPLTADEILEDVVGCEEIRKKLKKTCAVVKYKKKNGEDPRESAPFNYLFLGAPGTGKTTIARKMGQMFHSLGLIPFDEVIETTASKFQTGYLGQAALKTRELFESAKGKVLFIDEAYQLNPGKGHNYMQEVVDEMVQCITSEEFKNQLIIILAGYEKEVKEMLLANQGLQSRFKECFYFHDLNEEEIVDMIQKKFTKENTRATMSQEAIDYLPTVAKQLKELSGFSNGRDVETFVMKLNECFIERYMESLEDDEETEEEVLLVDAKKAMQEFKDQRKKPRDNNNNNRSGSNTASSSSSSNPPPPPPPPPMTANQRQPPPPVFSTSTSAATEQKEEEKEEEKDDIKAKKDLNEDDDWLTIDRDDGDDDITEEDWDEVDPLVRSILQVLFNEKKWTDNEQMLTLLIQADSNAPIIKSLLSEVETRLGFSFTSEEIQKMWDIWQRNQKKVNKAKEKQKRKKSQAEKEGKKKCLVPIWRCGVCGRADQPYIACYVAPFIVRYEERDL